MPFRSRSSEVVVHQGPSVDWKGMRSGTLFSTLSALADAATPPANIAARQSAAITARKRHRSLRSGTLREQLLHDALIRERAGISEVRDIAFGYLP